MAEDIQYIIRASKTQLQFINSTAIENCIMGPRGEGKTEAGYMAMTSHAAMQHPSNRPIPWAIIRDTWTNLERTTLKSLLFPRPGSFTESIRSRLQVKDGGAIIILPGLWEAFLFGVDGLSDLNKLQSMQLGGLWLEEAAPAMEEDIGSGISEETWLIGLTSLRHPVTTGPRAQITMNYPSEDHWTWKRFFDEENPDRVLFRIKKGENRHISEQYRHIMAEALKGKPELLARLVEGRPAQVVIGEKVTPEYNPDIHRSNQVLMPIPNIEVIRYWDGGLHPACVFGQITAGGQFHGLGTVQAENIGMKQFITLHVKPFIYGKFQNVKKWKDTGDPTLNTPDSGDSSVRPAQVIEGELGTVFIPGESSWQARREAMKELLTRLIDGKSMFQLSRDDTILHRALNGGWHYHKTPTGQVINDKPVKDQWSHPADALSHGIAKLFRYSPHKNLPPVQVFNLAKSYQIDLDYKRRYG